MNLKLLKKHIESYKKLIEDSPGKFSEENEARKERIEFYRSWTKKRILSMSEEDFCLYISRLWAMLIWGNKKYAADKIISDNGFDILKKELAELVWGKGEIAGRWDRFRKNIKGVGPGMMSEILCYVYPDDCIIWNSKAFTGFKYLSVQNLPRHNYQMTGKKYAELSEIAKEISKEMNKAGFKEVSLLNVDYFIWEELQAAEALQNDSALDQMTGELPEAATDSETYEFIHNEIRDKLADIGQWLGFKSVTEQKVAEGSKVDTIWEATIGNMGRIIYVFEVQTKGSIDSLIVNLLKSLNNPAVQGVVAVSDSVQIEKIKKHAAQVPNLNTKLKCWDYRKVMQIHSALEMVNESINSLGLVPQGF